MKQPLENIFCCAIIPFAIIKYWQEKTMEKIKNFFKNEKQTLFSELNKWEYLSWWVLRLAMLIALVYYFPSDDFLKKLLLAVNLLATFTIPLARIILFPKWLIKKMPFRCQTWLNIIVFFGSFLSQALNFNHTIEGYDKFLHFLTGLIVVFIGYELSKMFLRKGDIVSPLFKTYSAVGFSFIAIVLWELFEFIVDFYWPGSSNQGYNVTPNENMIFFKIFGKGAGNVGQYPIFDTNIDMLYAAVGTIISAAILIFVLYKKQGKKLKAE